MKRFVLFAVLMCFVLPVSAEGPSFGYSVSTRGFSIPGVSVYEQGAVDLLWRPNTGYLTLRAGVSVPAGDGWFANALFAGGADLTILRLYEHPFKRVLSLENRYAPSLGAGLVFSLDTNDVFLYASAHPVKFEVGGGYISVLAPLLAMDVFSMYDSFMPGWGISLFDIGFYIW